jgi:hypothetical protein
VQRFGFLERNTFASRLACFVWMKNASNRKMQPIGGAVQSSCSRTGATARIAMKTASVSDNAGVSNFLNRCRAA